MAVYKRNYRAYTGKVTPAWTRVLVLARYAFGGSMVIEDHGWAFHALPAALHRFADSEFISQITQSPERW